MLGSFRAFLDASVLYPVSLRNLLMRLTLGGLYQARWSAHVHEEWINAVRNQLGSDAHAAEVVAALYDRLEAAMITPDMFAAPEIPQERGRRGGDPGAIRTRDPQLRRLVLYPG